MNLHLLNVELRNVRQMPQKAFAGKIDADKSAAVATCAIVNEANAEIEAWNQAPHAAKMPLIANPTPKDWFEILEQAQIAMLICQHGMSAEGAVDFVKVACHQELVERCGYGVWLEPIVVDEMPQSSLAQALDDGMSDLEGLLHIHHNGEDAEDPEYEEETAQKFRDAFEPAVRLCEAPFGTIAYEPANDEGPAGIIADALANLSCVITTECFDKAESGYFVLANGQEFDFSVSRRVGHA